MFVFFTFFVLELNADTGQPASLGRLARQGALTVEKAPRITLQPVYFTETYTARSQRLSLQGLTCVPGGLQVSTLKRKSLCFTL